MSKFNICIVCGLFIVALVPAAHSQQESGRYELTGLAGGAKVPDTRLSTPGGQESTTGTSPATSAWQANFGWRAFNWGVATVFVEVPVTSAVSQKSEVTDKGGTIFSPDRATYFITPGLRFRFLNKRLSPFAVVGFGVDSTNLEEARIVTSGSSLEGSLFSHRSYKGAFDLGGGFDVKLERHFSLRAEFRDFIRTGKSSAQSGTTTVIQDVLPSRHALVPVAGVVVRF